MRLSVRVADYAARAVPHSVAVRVRQSPRLTRIVRGTLNAVVPAHLEHVEVAAGPVAGARMLLDLKREKSYWAGTYEPWVQDTLIELLAGGGVAWDVGAYVGYHTLLLHRLCGPQRVVAIEPHAPSRERLEANLSLNHALGVEIVGAAVLDEARTGSIVAHRDPAANGVQVPPVQGAPSVPTVRLDDLLASQRRPSVVKMDIEGAEADALAGATTLLADVRPAFVLELHKRAGLRALMLLQRADYVVRSVRQTADVVAELRAGGTTHVVALPS